MKSVAERDLATVRDWKLIGIAIATAAGAVEAKLLAENPHLAFSAGLQGIAQDDPPPIKDKNRAYPVRTCKNARFFPSAGC